MTRNWKRIIVIGSGVCGLALWHALAGDPEAVAGQQRPLPKGVSTDLITKGHAIFQGKAGCFNCHGPDGRGSIWAPALNDAERLNLQTASYEEIQSLIRAGVPKPKRHLAAMPPMGGAQLSDEEIRAVAAYVFTIDRGK